MTAKTSAYYQSRYRARLKKSGLVKREVWIPAEHAKALKQCEEALRRGIEPIIPKAKRKTSMSQDESWTTESLLKALQESGPARDGDIDVELVEGSEPGIHLIMKEFGDLPLFMSVSGDQIIVDTLLWPLDDVADKAAFNDMALRTHKYFPLSTFGISKGPDGRDYYEMFGALSAGSILDSVLSEIDTLADNVLQAVEACRDELKKTA
jgi:uncharacterized protein